MNVERPDPWQTAARAGPVQYVPRGMRSWTALWWLVDGRRVSIMRVMVAGPQDIDYALRIHPLGADRPNVWLRVQRIPIDRDDNGTRWVGPIPTTRTESAHYLAHHLMDKQGGVVGHGYAIEIRHDGRLPLPVDQFYLKLDPRRRV